MSRDKKPNKFRSGSARKRSWDYSAPGSYFVTICTKDKYHFFGRVVANGFEYTPIGQVANDCWLEIPKHFPFVELGAHVIMPNHVHGIITIKSDAGARPIVLPAGVQITPVGKQNFASLRGPTDVARRQTNTPKPPAKNKFGPQSKNLASIVRGFKTGVSKYATMYNIQFAWQPRYHDRIIRDDRGFFAVTKYIENNVRNWENDPFNNPGNQK